MRTRSLAVAAGLVLGIGGLTLAAPDPVAFRPAEPLNDDPKIPFERYTLDNGLEVILAPDPSVPLIALNVWYHVGSGDDVPGKTGFAHLFEHMLFQGTANTGADRHFAILKEAGASETQGTTNQDRTNYYETLPSHQLELGLWLDKSERMSHLLPALTQESLAGQQEVVRNERRERYDDVPYGSARFAIAHALYPDGHPYRDLTIGKHEDLMGASLDDVKNFYRTWYVPANATLAIAGDFDPATIKATVFKWFGNFPTSVKPTVVMVPPPAQKASRTELVDSFAALRRISWAWHSPASYGPGDAELDIAADALTRPGTGRLYRILVHEQQLAQSVSASQRGAMFSGQFQLDVVLRSGADAAAVERIVTDELNRLRSEAISDRERERTVTAAEAGAVRTMESLQSRIDRLQFFNHYLGDPDGLTRSLDRYRTATPESVRATVAQYLDPATAVVVVSTPKPAAAPKAVTP